MKELFHIRTKSMLQKLYCSQIPEKEIRSEINVIISASRKNHLFARKIHFAKALRTNEVIIFIDRNGVPDGYKLSEELEHKLTAYRKEVATERASLKRAEKRFKP